MLMKMMRITLGAGVCVLALAGTALAQTPEAQTPPVQVPPPPVQTPPPAQTPPPLLPPAVARPTPPPAVAVPFPADWKIGFINLQAVFAQSNLGKAGQKQMQILKDKKTAEATAKDQAIQSLTKDIQQQSAVLSAAAIAAKNGELDRLQRDFQFFQQNAQAEGDALQQQILANFEEKVVPIVEALAKEKGLYVVWDVQNSGAAYVYPGLDLSAEVVKRLDAKASGSDKQ